jgi:prepilin-type N-terminal cleavage/methylation domain-containing protein
MNTTFQRNAFTLLEILLVVAAVGILAAMVIVAINPTKQLEKVRDSERTSEVNTLRTALMEYQIDNNGNLNLPRYLTEVCDTGEKSPSEVANSDCDADELDLSYLVPKYLAAIPEDPQLSGVPGVEETYAAGDATGYFVSQGVKSDPYVQTEGEQTAVVAAGEPQTDWYEVGRVSNKNANWETINFKNEYTNPVVVGNTNTYNENEPGLIVETRNVTSDSADIRICELEGLQSVCDSAHATETIGYLVVGADAVQNKTSIKAGTTASSKTRSSYSFNSDFANRPYVFATVRTKTENEPTTVQIPDVHDSGSGFDHYVCAQDTTYQNNCQSSLGEDISWVALNPQVEPLFPGEYGTGSVKSGGWAPSWKSGTFTPSFSQPPVVLGDLNSHDGGQEPLIEEVRNVTTSDFEIRFCEQDNEDYCDSHAGNTVRRLALPETN